MMAKRLWKAIIIEFHKSFHLTIPSWMSMRDLSNSVWRRRSSDECLQIYNVKSKLTVYTVYYLRCTNAIEPFYDIRLATIIIWLSIRFIGFKVLRWRNMMIFWESGKAIFPLRLVVFFNWYKCQFSSQTTLVYRVEVDQFRQGWETKPFLMRLICERK